jgi:hypothetical protein
MIFARMFKHYSEVCRFVGEKERELGGERTYFILFLIQKIKKLSTPIVKEQKLVRK